MNSLLAFRHAKWVFHPFRLKYLDNNSPKHYLCSIKFNQKYPTMYEQDDTIFNSKSTTAINQSDKKRISKDALKMAAAALAGAGVGAGAMWAGTSFASEPTPASNPDSVPAADQQPSEKPMAEADNTAEESPKVELKASAETATNAKSSNSHPSHSAPKHDPEPEAKPEPAHAESESTPAIYHERIQIGEVQDVTDDEGNTIRLAQGTVDGHDAVSRIDEHNRVVAAIVDSNDNGEFESSEIVDLRGESIQVGGATPVANNEVQVISVENDVDLNGHAVNIAHIAVGDDEALLVDANQNGEADFLVHDDNGNNQIDDGEVHDISDSHMPMPQLDDVSGADGHLVQNDGLPDYSNDADITMYEA